ncbi:MAG: hypothetical protein WCP61_07955 [Chitinophagia bacterium]
MGILSDMVDNFFKSLQSGVSNLYEQEAQRQWDINHPVETLEDQITRKQKEKEIEKQEIEAKVNLEKYNIRVQQEKEDFLKKHNT